MGGKGQQSFGGSFTPLPADWAKPIIKPGQKSQKPRSEERSVRGPSAPKGVQWGDPFTPAQRQGMLQALTMGLMGDDKDKGTSVAEKNPTDRDRGYRGDAEKNPSGLLEESEKNPSGLLF